MSKSNLPTPITTGPLQAKGVQVRAGSTTILDGLSFSLQPGELVALIGPSGAGKSTLIKVLLGLRDPSQGSVSLGGAPLSKASTPVGYVPQHDALHTTLTVKTALDFAAQLRLPHLEEKRRRDRITEVCGQVGLADRMDLKIGRLSGGQQKRVSVAMELLTQPDVLILDEPTSGLDPGLEAKMMGLFQDLAKGGRIVLVATHAMQSLERCDALMVLVRGQMAFLGHPTDALSFFRVDRFAGLFEQLPKQTPSAWQKAWARSDERRRFESRTPPEPKHVLPKTTGVAPPPAASNNSPPGSNPKPAQEDSPTPSPQERLEALKQLRKKRGQP